MEQISVIAENEYCVVIDKPAGLIVHSDGRTEEPTLVEWILSKYPTLTEVGEPWLSPQGVWYPRPGIVHRLDRTTSGIMLLAKTNNVYAYLKKEFKERRVIKKYRAIVYGHMEKDAGEIVAEIMRSIETPKRWYARVTTRDDVRTAITEWRLLERREAGEAISDLEVTPLTGRTHQIRVHLASIGHPLVSDHLYAVGHTQLLGFTHPALHALSITLTLPNGNSVSYESLLPPEFRA